MNRLQSDIILLLTNNPAIQFWMKKNLEKDFFLVVAQSELEAVDAAENTRLNFVFVDEEFAQNDTLKVCNRIYQILKRDVPILLITGSLKKTYLDAAKLAGVSTFLSKTLDLEEIQTQINILRKNQELKNKTNRIFNPNEDS